MPGDWTRQDMEKGHWVNQDTNEEIKPDDRSGLESIIRDYVDNDSGEFEDWARDECESEILGKFFFECGHYMDDYYDSLVDMFVEWKVDEVLSNPGEDFNLGNTKYCWKEDRHMVRVEIHATGITEYDANETTLEDHMKHEFPCLKDFSVTARPMREE